jgi:hypothetical protein
VSVQRIRTALFIVIATVVIARTEFGAQIPQLDHAVFERPQPAAEIDAKSPAAVIDRALQILKAEKFKIVRVARTQGDIIAVRRDNEGEDRVILWLERDLVKPTTLRLYLLCGRFEPFVGKPGLQRLMLDENQDGQRFGSLRIALSELNSRGI